MKLRKISVRNLRSYKDQEVIFPEGSLLLSGDIGSGKTSILLAIEYALFGLQAGQKGNSLLRNNEQNAEVILELEASGKPIVIERRLKRTTKGVSNEYAAITIDGEKEESSLTEIKHKIISLLGYPEEFVKKNNMLYRYTVYTQQESMKQIILEDAETRLNILRHVFGIDKYKTIKSNLTILVSDIKSDSKVLQGEIATLEEDRSSLLSRKSRLKETEEKIRKKSDELEAETKVKKAIELEISELGSKINEKREFEKEAEKTKILIVTKRETLSSILRETKELSKAISESGPIFSEQEYSNLLIQINKKKSISENYNSQLVDFSGMVNSLQKEKLDILNKKDRIFRIDICPTCLQDVSETHKHNILNEAETKLSTIKKQLERLEKDQTLLVTHIKKNKENISDLEENKVKLEILRAKLDQLEKSKSKLLGLQKQKQNIEEDEIMLSNHLDSLKEKILIFSVFESQYKQKEEALGRALQDEKSVEIALAELRREIEIEKREIVLAKELITLKENSKNKLQNITELLDWLNQKFLNLINLTERNVMMKLRSEFSTLFQKWFTMLVPENTLNSHLDENFTPIITQRDVEMDYSFLSGGERTAVALAYRLALNQTINSLMSRIQTKGIIILDEPTEGFSEAQIDKVRDILEELKAEQLIIVSHEQKIEGFVDNVLKVSKKGDISSIE